MEITLGTSTITKEVRDNLKECCDENRLGEGKFVKKFEDKVAKFIGIKHAIATCNGTMADIIALAALKHLNPTKTEVIVPSLTFVAHINSVVVNGLTPVFVDVNYDYQIDTEEIKKAISDKTLAIMPVHLLGKKCDIDEIVKIAGDIPILEDCCEAFGVKPKQIGTYSFFPSHTITTGEGGMIVTDDDELAELCRKLRNHGRRSENILEKFHFDMIGFNGKMSNITAAIGEAIIDMAFEIIKKRKENVEIFNKATGQDWYAESPHCYPIMYETEIERDLMLMELYNNGIEARKIFSSLPTQESIYKNYKLISCQKAEFIGEKGLYVPCHQNLTDKELEKICQNIKSL